MIIKNEKTKESSCYQTIYCTSQHEMYKNSSDSISSNNEAHLFKKEYDWCMTASVHVCYLVISSSVRPQMTNGLSFSLTQRTGVCALTQFLHSSACNSCQFIKNVTVSWCQGEACEVSCCRQEYTLPH